MTTTQSAHTNPTVSNADLGAEYPESTELFQQAMVAMMALKLAPPSDFPVRVTKDEDAIMIAMGASLRADCNRRKVACAVIDAHGYVLGTGRNGAPAGRPGCLSAGACPRGQMSVDQVKPGSGYGPGSGLCNALHAEKNGLLVTDPLRRRGGCMAITDAPCDPCALDLAGSNLARYIFPVFTPDGLWVVGSRLIGPEHPIGGHYS